MSADLDSSEKRTRWIKDDLARIADVYGDRRRTEIRGERADQLPPFTRP